MAKNSVTTRVKIFINQPREEVWRFTQDHDRRPQWDGAVQHVAVSQTGPEKVVIQKGKGSIINYVYQHDEYPFKTIMIAKDVRSSLIGSAETMWTYEPHHRGTLWAICNTVVLKKGILRWPLRPLYKKAFHARLRKAMLRAKTMMEESNPSITVE